MVDGFVYYIVEWTWRNSKSGVICKSSYRIDGEKNEADMLE